jgi:hypothetical protein
VKVDVCNRHFRWLSHGRRFADGLFAAEQHKVDSHKPKAIVLSDSAEPVPVRERHQPTVSLAGGLLRIEGAVTGDRLGDSQSRSLFERAILIIRFLGFRRPNAFARACSKQKSNSSCSKTNWPDGCSGARCVLSFSDLKTTRLVLVSHPRIW